MIGLWIAPFVVALICYLTFAVGAYRLFGHVSRATVGWRFIQLMAPTVAVAILYSISVDRSGEPLQYLCSTLILGLSLSLFLWAARSLHGVKLPLIFADELPPEVVATGPYRLMRHPMYVSYILAYIGGCVAGPSLISFAAAGVASVTYVVAAIEEEKRLLSSEHADSYSALTGKAGRFLPKRRG